MELSSSSSSCVACVGWIERYFGDCVCSPRSEASFALGIASLLCWGVAEIPQIASNFLNKSGHGVSLTFLLAWVAGDLFNLVGCLLEPVTLPTQLYTALLYTATTVVLLLQVLYYDYWSSRRKSSGFVSRAKVGYGTFMATSLTLPFHTKASTEGLQLQLMQKAVTVPSQGNPYGQLLGWVMAAIYMGGRLPQIYLNIKQGSVEGLNPLMFLFALIANATYVGSILLRSREWEKIKGNAPWLLDAVVCVLLDLFIILQFAYYKSVQKSESDEEIKQPII